jgi:hypothetical protein
MTVSAEPERLPASPSSAALPASKKQLSLALQGGGAFGAFTSGVLDCLLEERDIAFVAVSVPAEHISATTMSCMSDGKPRQDSSWPILMSKRSRDCASC